MHRATIVTLAAFAVVMSSGLAHATDHLYFNVEPGETKGAGWGELSPGPQDLRITVNLPSGWDSATADTGDITGWTMWQIESWSSTSITWVAYGYHEENMGWLSVIGELYEITDPGNVQEFEIRVANCLWGSNFFENDQWHEAEVCLAPGGQTSVGVSVHHGLSGTLTVLGASSDLEVLNPDETPFTSADLTGDGISSVSLLLRADNEFSGQVTLTARFLQDGAELDSQDVLIVRAGVQVVEITLTQTALETKEVGDQITWDDLVIVTNPEGYEHLVQVDPLPKTIELGENVITASACSSTAHLVFYGVITSFEDMDIVIGPDEADDLVDYMVMIEGADGSFFLEEPGPVTGGDTSGSLEDGVPFYGTVTHMAAPGTEPSIEEPADLYAGAGFPPQQPGIENRAFRFATLASIPAAPSESESHGPAPLVLWASWKVSAAAIATGAAVVAAAIAYRNMHTEYKNGAVGGGGEIFLEAGANADPDWSATQIDSEVHGSTGGAGQAKYYKGVHQYTAFPLLRVTVDEPAPQKVTDGEDVDWFPVTEIFRPLFFGWLTSAPGAGCTLTIAHNRKKSPFQNFQTAGRLRIDEASGWARHQHSTNIQASW